MISRFNRWKEKTWFKTITNIYVVILSVFAIWMLFFDTNSLMIQRELQNEIDELEAQKIFLIQEINKDRAALKELNRPEAMEKVAREKYQYHRADEDVYLIEFKDSINPQDE